MIHNITPAVDYNYWLKCMNNTKLKEPTNQNSIKVPNNVKPTNKKHYYKTSVINSFMYT